MTNTVLIKRSGTPTDTPLAANLQHGELAINYSDGNLFYKNASNVVTVIASNQFLSVTGNVTGGNIITVGNVSATGNISGDYFIGNGRFLTGISGGGGNVIGGNLVVYSRTGTVLIPIVSGYLNVVGRTGTISIPIAA